MLYVRGHELVQLAMQPQSTLGNCSDSRSGISCGSLIESCAAAWLDATAREQKGATGCHPVHRFTCTDTHARRDTFRQTEAHIQTCLNAYITANCFWKSRLYSMISMLAPSLTSTHTHTQSPSLPASAACVLRWIRGEGGVGNNPQGKPNPCLNRHIQTNALCPSASSYLPLMVTVHTRSHTHGSTHTLTTP